MLYSYRRNRKDVILGSIYLSPEKSIACREGKSRAKVLESHACFDTTEKLFTYGEPRDGFQMRHPVLPPTMAVKTPAMLRPYKNNSSPKDTSHNGGAHIQQQQPMQQDKERAKQIPKQISTGYRPSNIRNARTRTSSRNLLPPHYKLFCWFHGRESSQQLQMWFSKHFFVPKLAA